MLIFSANVNAKRGEVAEIQSVSALPIRGTYSVDYLLQRYHSLVLLALRELDYLLLIAVCSVAFTITDFTNPQHLYLITCT